MIPRLFTEIGGVLRFTTTGTEIWDGTWDGTWDGVITDI